MDKLLSELKAEISRKQAEHVAELQARVARQQAEQSQNIRRDNTLAWLKLKLKDTQEDIKDQTKTTSQTVEDAFNDYWKRQQYLEDSLEPFYSSQVAMQKTWEEYNVYLSDCMLKRKQWEKLLHD